MQYSLYQPFGYSEIGLRANNEDSIFPNSTSVNTSDRLFLVCDGVGGAEKGEIASELACRSFSEFFENNNIQISDKELIQQALDYVENAFDLYIDQHPSSSGMGTTATLLHLNQNGATIAHVGDSRAYLLRRNQSKYEVIHRTRDHSFPMELYENGFITYEQAKNHPRKNEITRAIQGKTVRDTRADVTVFNEVKEGDVFFLCTDGVLEQIDDQILVEVVSQIEDPEFIGKELKDISEGQTRDNFSAYIIKIKNISSIHPIQIQSIDNPSGFPRDIPLNQLKPSFNIQSNYFPSKKKSNLWLWLISTLLFIGSLVGGYYLYKNSFEKDSLKKENKNLNNDKKKAEEKTSISTYQPIKNSIPTPIPSKDSVTVSPRVENKHEIEPNSKKEKKNSENTAISNPQKLKETYINKIEDKKNKPSNEVTSSRIEWNSYLYLLKKDNKFGLINRNNEIKLKPIYDEIIKDDEKIEQGFGKVRNGDKYGFLYIPKKGEIQIIKPQFDKIIIVIQDRKRARVEKDGTENEITLTPLLKKQ